MKLSSIVFDKPVKVRGSMVQSLTSSSEVGRLGTASPVQMVLQEGFVEVSGTEGTLVVVPIGNVVCFVPAPTPAPAAKK